MLKSIRWRRFPLIRFVCISVIGCLWIRGHFHSDIFSIFLRHGTAQGLMNDRGQVVLFFTNIRLGEPRAYTFDYLEMPNTEFEDIRVRLFATPPLPIRMFGLQFGFSGQDPFGIWGARYHFIIVPMWMLAIVSGLPLGIGLRTFWLRRRWGTANICNGCGYDLRASLERCPECGLVPV